MGVRVLSRFDWHRVKSIGGIVRIWQSTFGVHKTHLISSQANLQSAYQEGLCSKEKVGRRNYTKLWMRRAFQYPILLWTLGYVTLFHLLWEQECFVYFQHTSGIRVPVGNSNAHTQDISYTRYNVIWLPNALFEFLPVPLALVFICCRHEFTDAKAIAYNNTA
jgi:hypothetical protein